jgi:hypothetical protein
MTDKSGICHTTCRHLRVERRDICFIKYIFEAYEGIAVLETMNGQSGHIALHTAPGCETVVADVLADLSRQCRMEAIETKKKSDT